MREFLVNAHELRNIAHEIDTLFDQGKDEDGRNLLDYALLHTATTPAYHAYFKAEQAWYVTRSSKEQGRLLQEAANADQDDIFLMRCIGIWQLMNDKVWSSVRTFDKILARHQDDADTLRCMGIAHSLLDRDRKAIRFYQSALAINPADGDALRQTGVSWSKLGEDQEALVWFRRALAINEQDYDAMRQMGISLAMLNDLEGAQEWLRLAQTINPHDYETRQNMALVMKKLRGDETWLERISIRMMRWFNHRWGKLLDLAGLR